MKRVICLLLCIAMVLSLAGCGQPTSETVETAAATESISAEAEETAPSVESYLSIAQKLMDDGDVEAAAQVLEQIREESDDPRIGEMLAQLNPMELKVTCVPSYTVSPYTRGDFSGGAVIHGAYAHVLADGTVRYTVSFTSTELEIVAPEEAKILDTSTGTSDKKLLVFDLAGDDVRLLGNNVQIKFLQDWGSYYRINLSVQWPEGVEPLTEGQKHTASLLTQMKTMEPQDLNVDMSLQYNQNNEDQEIIHSLTAQEMPGGMVRFTLDYTARAGTPLHIIGGSLSYDSEFKSVNSDYFGNFKATGGKDRFVFELSVRDVRRIGGFTIEFGSWDSPLLTVTVRVSWPDEQGAALLSSEATPAGESVDIAFEASEEVAVQKFTRQWLDNESFRYSLHLTAPKDLTVTVTDPEGQVFFGPLATTSAPMEFTFDLPWAAASRAPKLRVRFADASGAVQASVTGYNGFLVTGETVVSEGRPLDHIESIEDENKDALVSFTAWDLTKDYVRYELVFDLPEEVTAEVCTRGEEIGSSHAYFAMRDFKDLSGGRQTLTFDLKKEDVAEAGHAVVQLNSGGNIFAYIMLYDPLAMNLTDGTPVGEEVKLEYFDNSFRRKNDIHIRSITGQPLDNEYVRFSVTYSAPEGTSIDATCEYMGGIAHYYHVVKSDENETFSFDYSFEHLQDRQNVYYLFEGMGGQYYATIYLYEDTLTSLGVPYKPIDNIKLTLVEYPGKPDDMPPKFEEGMGVAPLLVNEVSYEVLTGTDKQKASSLEALAENLEKQAAELAKRAELDIRPAQTVDTSVIQPLEVSRKLVTPKAQSGIQPYDEFWFEAMPENVDLTGNLPLAYALGFSDVTKFPEKMPAGFDPQALLDWGKDPGLNVEVLHKLGYTGKGAVIAYIDQPIHDHPAYANVNLHYTNNTDKETTMHGPSVLSLLAGKEIGTAPEAEVYFYGHADWEADQMSHAQCLYQIIDQNKSLPEGEKITMVGFSDNIDPNEKNAADFEKAVEACEDAGIMVWFCGEYGAASFYPMSDKNSFENVVREHWDSQAPELVMVPAGGRTTANGEGSGDYTYWASGGLSWTMPYVLGLYAIVTEIDPGLSQDDLRARIVDTAYVKNDMKIVNPVEFVAAALDGVGKKAEAEELRTAAQRNGKYFYAVMNKSAMTEEDIAGAEAYLANITDATVLVVDTREIKTAQELYTILQADHIQRGGTVKGIQLFGDPTLVPAFEVGYKVQMADSVDNMGTLLTDLFFGNFSNRAEDLSKNYNVLDHFANNWPVQVTPEWPVARLPLVKGEFAPFFEKYAAFAEETGLSRLDLVNFDNPIFAQEEHIDAMGEFLNRAKDEFGILNTPYRLYGNQLGDYPVTTEILGGFTAENLTKENSQGIVEFLINSHGQKDNLDKCFFENGKEKRESLMNSDNMNEVLSENPYYLDLWTCNGGEDMRDNLTTTALKGQCVGVFSDTHVISNNGVNWEADLSSMAQSNFYYFYLHYLNALDQGTSRSEAFFRAQKNYANALIADSANGIRKYEGNYQFNIMNLVGYHNFGLIEPSKAAPCVDTTLK